MTGRQDTVTSFPLLAEASRLISDGKLEFAARRTIAHLRRHPDEPRGLAQLGQIALQLGALGQAENFLRRAIEHGAKDFETRRNLASVLNQQERVDEAHAMFEQLSKEADDPSLRAIRALIFDKLGHNDEALATLEALTNEYPERPHYWISYGHSLRATGRVDDAIAAYRTAAAADYELGDAWWSLASIKKRVLTDADMKDIRRGIAVAIDIRNSAPLHFALARALHDREEFQEAFEHYAEGNRQRAESLGYDAAELTAEIAETERSVDTNYIVAQQSAMENEATPVFVVSLPRSGSTLLEQMLGSHPDVEPVGELPYAPAILRSAMEMATRKSPVTVPRLIAQLSDDQAEAMGRDYLRRAALHRKTERPYFVDKLPHNWSNILFIRRILPHARFIDIRRNPIDCCFSNFTQSFSSAHASSFALKDIGQCYVDYTRLMRHFDRVAPGMIYHVGYERLIEHAESEMKAVLGYLGLAWTPSVLEFHRLERVVRTPSSEQVRRPLNRDGVDAWKPYAEWLGPLNEVLAALPDQ